MKIKEKELERIKKMAKEEFPDDPALQQVHMARKVIAREAELEGLTFAQYARSIARQVKKSMKERAAQPR